MNQDNTAVLCCPDFCWWKAEVVNGEWSWTVQTPRQPVGCPVCGAVANVKDRRMVTVRDLPVGGTPVILRWRKRIFQCRYVLCENKTWTEQHAAIAPRAVLTERARQWAFEQVGFHDRAVSAVAAELGVSWHTIMTQVSGRGKPLISDLARLDGCQRSASTRPRSCGPPAHPTLYATGIADLTAGRPAVAARCHPGPVRHRAGRLARRRGTSPGAPDRHGVVGSVPWLRHRAGHPAAGRDPGSRPLPCRETGPDLR